MAAGAVLLIGSGAVTAASLPISDDQVLIRARASLISAGTEVSASNTLRPNGALRRVGFKAFFFGQLGE